MAPDDVVAVGGLVLRHRLLLPAGSRARALSTRRRRSRGDRRGRRPPVTLAPRTAVVIAALALLSLLLPLPVVLLLLAALGGAVAVDAVRARRAPVVTRALPQIVVRGVPAELRLRDWPRPAMSGCGSRGPPTWTSSPGKPTGHSAQRSWPGAGGVISCPRPQAVSPARSGSAPGLIARVSRPSLSSTPTFPAHDGSPRRCGADKLRDEGRRRGPLGIGTEFESVRDYLPDDDFRHINWRAAARLGRPMSNQFRVERDRDVVCVVDCGRLMAAPAARARTCSTRRSMRRSRSPRSRRSSATAAGRSLSQVRFPADAQPSPAREPSAVSACALRPRTLPGFDSDYERAFRWGGSERSKRAFVLVLTDVLDEAAAQPCSRRCRCSARRHAVAVAAAGADLELRELVEVEPARRIDVYRTAVALDVLAARSRTVTLLRGAGADVVEAPAS